MFLQKCDLRARRERREPGTGTREPDGNCQNGRDSGLRKARTQSLRPRQIQPEEIGQNPLIDLRPPRGQGVGGGEECGIAPRELAERWQWSRSSLDRIARRAGLTRLCLGQGKNGIVRYIREEVIAYEQSRRVQLVP